MPVSFVAPYTRVTSSSWSSASELATNTMSSAYCSRGGFRHVQHVRPNRGPT